MNTATRSIGVIAIVLLIAHTAAGDLLVGSWQTDSIRRYDDSGFYLGDFVPTGTGGLDLPDGMDFGADGHLYVSSSDSNAILRYDGTTGAFIDAFVSKGLNSPGNLQFGPDGLLYVCNKSAGQVLRFDPGSGDLVDVFASGGGLVQPVGLLWDAGLLYVADFSGNAIRRYNATTGAYVDDFVSIATPLILNHDHLGNIMISSHNLDNVLRFATDGTPLGNFLAGGLVDCPVGYAFDGGDELIVASWQNHRLLRYDAQSGAYLGEFAIGNGLFLPNDLLWFPTVQEVSPDTFEVTQGDFVTGGLPELAESDNLIFTLRRRSADLQSRTEFEVKSTSPTATPTTFEFTLEGSVFARGNVVQTIELFDYDLGTWELVDTTNAARAPMPDKVVTATPTGDLSRFVEAGTMCIAARIRYKSDANRQKFASNTDQAIWTIGQ